MFNQKLQTPLVALRSHALIRQLSSRIWQTLSHGSWQREILTQPATRMEWLATERRSNMHLGVIAGCITTVNRIARRSFSTPGVATLLAAGTLPASTARSTCQGAPQIRTTENLSGVPSRHDACACGTNKPVDIDSTNQTAINDTRPVYLPFGYAP